LLVGRQWAARPSETELGWSARFESWSAHRSTVLRSSSPAAGARSAKRSGMHHLYVVCWIRGTDGNIVLLHGMQSDHVPLGIDDQ
jgi:hypothetical protein